MPGQWTPGAAVDLESPEGRLEVDMDTLAREAQEALRQRSQRLRARAGAPAAELDDSSEGLTDSERRELDAIDEALARIDGGEFGRCARCGGAIGRHRLRAVPEARHCMTCSAVVER